MQFRKGQSLPSGSVRQGRPSPWGHDASPLCFRFPLILQTFSDSVENFQNFTFSQKIFPFSSAKIFDELFLVNDRKFRISPLFSLFQYISPCFAKIIISPSKNFIPCFQKNYLLFTYFMCISFPPYFDHDAFMHHPLHVLDASDARFLFSENVSTRVGYFLPVLPSCVCINHARYGLCRLCVIRSLLHCGAPVNSLPTWDAFPNLPTSGVSLF